MGKLLFFIFLMMTSGIMISTTAEHKKESNHESPVQTDGPYVTYSGSLVYVSYIMEKNGKKFVKSEGVNADMKSSLRLVVNTDVPGKIFQFRLKRKMKNEKSEFPEEKKLLVLSDIEGNFSALKKLLEAASVIDQNFNWIFGKGHLVLLGDFFDRGGNVTESLWLIYYLEEKAKSAGGYVHFILGNHEIMNLSGDLRYTQKKYLENARLITGDYLTLYDESSELGKWLRTKNIVEKIGDLLFVHGGISGDLLRLNMPLKSINSLAQPYYGNDGFDDDDKIVNLVFGQYGPFWYRGYYENPAAAMQAQVDSALSQFRVKRIITGHTIVQDTISTLFNGKLIDVDVHHAAGNSESLLIEDGKYYRINAEGEKMFLMEDEK